MSAGFECSYNKLSPFGFIKYQVPMQQMGPFFYRWVRRGTCPSLRAILRKWPHRRSGDLVILNSACGMWCTCWNGDQTERTSRAYKSSMWAWTSIYEKFSQCSKQNVYGTCSSITSWSLVQVLTIWDQVPSGMTKVLISQKCMLPKGNKVSY